MRGRAVPFVLSFFTASWSFAASANAQAVATAAAPATSAPSPPAAMPAAAPVPVVAPGAAPKSAANAAAAASSDQEGPVSFVMFGLAEFGNTEAAEFRIGNMSETMSLNDGYSALAGVAITLARSPNVKLDTSLALGIKYDSMGENGLELRYMSFPLQVNTQLTFGALRFGGGVAHQLAPSFKLSVDGTSDELDVETSLGPFVEAGLAFPVGRGALWFSARYLWQTMSAADQPGSKTDADALGLSIGWAP